MTAFVAEAKRKGRSPIGLLALGVLIVAMVVGLVIVKNAQAAVICTWINGATGNWGSAGNWSCDSGAGARVPLATDEIVFSGTMGATVNVAAVGAKLTFTSSGTLDFANGAVNTLTIGTGGIDQSAGTITAGTGGTLTAGTGGVGGYSLTGTAAYTGAAPALTVSETLTINTSGTFTAPSGTLTTTGFTHSTGTFTHNSGTVVFSGAAGTIDLPTSTTFNNVTFNASTLGASKTVANSDTLVVNGTLTLQEGSVDQATVPASGTLAAKGNITQSGSTFDDSTGTLLIDGTGAQTLTGASGVSAGALPAVIINKTSGTLTLANTIRTMRSWTYTAGTLAPGASTVVFSRNSGTSVVSGTHTLNNVTFNSATSASVEVAAGTTLTVPGALSLRDGFINNTGVVEAQGSIDQVNTNFDGGTATILINGTGAQTFSGAATASGGLLPNLNINKATGTLLLTGTIRTGKNWTYTTGTVDPGTSTVAFGSAALQISGSHTLFNVTFQGAVAYTVAGGTTLTTTGTLTLTDGTLDTGTVAAQGAVAQAQTFDGGTGTLLLNGAGSPTFTGSASTSAGLLPAVTINRTGGTLTLAGIIRTARDWTYTAGTVAPGTSQVVFSGSNTITGSHTLFDVTLNGANATYSINSGDTLTTTGALLLTDGFINTGTLAAQGAITQNSGFDGGTGSLLINSTIAGQTLTGGGSTTSGDLPAVTIAKSAQVLNLANTIRTTHNWTFTSGGTTTAAAATVVAFAGGTIAGVTSYPANATFTFVGATTLGADITVNGPTSFDGGILTTSTNVYHAVGAVSRPTTGHVNGNLRKSVAGTGAVTFQVGGTSIYRPMTATINTVTGSGTLTASNVNGDHSSNATSGLDATKSVNAFWTLTQSGGMSGLNYDLAFTYVAGDLDGGATAANLKLGKLNGSWSLPTVSGTPTATSLTATGLTSFSDFWIGETAGVSDFLVEATGGGAIATQTAGVSFNIKITARNGGGGTVTAFTGTVDLTSNRVIGAGGGTTASFTAGVLTSHAITLNQSGASSTITATRTTGGAETGTSAGFTVNAGAVSKLQLLMPGETAAPGTGSGKTGSPSARTAGSSFNVTVNGVDANWNVVTGYTDTVAITSSDANATLPANAALASGTGSFAVTLKTAGSRTVTATDATDGSETANTSPSTTVNPGAFTKLQILVPGESAAPGTGSGKTGSPTAHTAGAAFNVTVNGVDANWNVVTSVTDMVQLSSSDADAALPVSTSLSSGTVSLSVTLTTAGSSTVTASDATDGSKTANTSPSITVNAGAFTKLQLLMPGESADAGSVTGKTGSPSARTAGSSFNGTVNAVDGNWNVIGSVTDTVGITTSDLNATLPANAALASGTGTFAVTFKTAGSRTVTATDITDGLKTANTSPLTTVNPGTFVKLQLLVPGETAAAGTATGKIGTPTSRNGGSAFDVVVNAVDANWNVVTSVTDTVGLTSTDGSATLPANTPLVAGTKTLSVTLATGGSQTITATDITDGTKTANTSPTITVSAVTNFLVEASTTGPIGTQTAGVGFTIKITARDGADATVTGFTGTVDITSNRVIGAGSGMTSAFTSGVLASHSITLNKAGATSTITATLTGGGASGTSVSFTIDPGAYSKLQLLMPGETAAPGTATGKTGSATAQTAGSSFNTTVNAVDANWNKVASVTDTVGITSDANATLPASAALASGTGSYAVTFKTAGSRTVTASDLSSGNGTQAADTGSATTVNPGAFAKLQLLMPGESADPGSATGKTGSPSAQTAAVLFSATVNAVDANWNLVSSVTDTVAISSSDANATLPANAALVSGTGSYSVTFKTAGSRTVTATDATDGTKTANTGSSTTVNAGAVNKLQLLMPGETADPGTATGKTGSPTARTAGASFNVTVNGVDANWNVVGSYTDTVAITTSDPNATLPANAALASGTGAFAVTFKTAGSRTVTATDATNGSETASTSPATTVNPGALNKLQILMPGETADPGTATGKTGSPNAQTAGSSFNATVNGVDANWNIVPSANDMVTISSSDANATLPASAALSSGTGTFAVTFKTAGSRTVTADDSGPLIANTSPSTTVNPGAFTKLQLLMPGEAADPGTASGKTGSPSARAAGASFSVTVNGVDANWNLVASVTDTVAITSSDANATLPANAALASGTGTFLVTLNAAGSRTVTATDATDGSKTANTSPSTTVNPGTFTKLQLLMPGETANPGSATGKTGSPSTRTAGTAFSVTVNAVDALWNVVPSVTDTVAITSTDTNATLPANAALASGTQTFSVNLKTAGSKTVTATDQTDGSKTANTSPATTVAPGAPDHITITSGSGTLAIGATRPITAEIRDTNQNVVTGDSTTVVDFTQTAGSGAVTGLGTATASAGIATKTVTGSSNGSVTITADETPSAGLTAGTTTFTVFSDVTPPALSSSTFTNGTLVLAFNEALEPDTIPTSAFTVTINGTPATVNSSVASGSSVTIGYTPAAIGTDTVRFTYTAPGSAPRIRDTSPANNATGNIPLTIAASGDSTAPTLSSAAVNGSTMTLTFSETLATPYPSASDFAVAFGGTAQASPTGISVSGATITLTLASAAANGTTVTVGYTPGANPVKDGFGNNAAAFSGQAVTNNTPAPAPAPAPSGGGGGGGGGGGAPPAITNVSPADGSTITSVSLITLTANKSVEWQSLTVERPDGTVVTLDPAFGTNIARSFSSTAPGLYTIRSRISDGGSSPVSTRSFFSIFTPSPASAPQTPANDPPPAEIHTGPGEAETLRSSDGLSSVSWSGSTFSDAIVLRSDPTPTGTTPNPQIFTDGSRVLQVTATRISDNARITQFSAPLDIEFPNAAATLTPAVSPDGIVWRPLQLLPSHDLPASQQDGYFRDGAGTVHILTRHLTFFGLLGQGSQATQLMRIASAKRIWLDTRHYVAVQVQLAVQSSLVGVLVDPQGQTTDVKWTIKRVRAGSTILRLPIPRTLNLDRGEYRFQLRATARGTTVGRTAKIRLLKTKPTTPFTPPFRTAGIVVPEGDDLQTLKLPAKYKVNAFAASDVLWATGIKAWFVEAVVVDLDRQNVSLVSGLRQVFPELRILVVTKSKTKAADARRAGATLVVLKPASGAVVSALLQTLIPR